MNTTVISIADTLPGTTATWEEMLTDETLSLQHQQVVYKKPGAVFMAMSLLREEGPPLTRMAEIQELKAELAEVAKGNAVIIQAGLCAEDMTKKNEDVEAYVGLMHDLEETVVKHTGKKVVLLGRVGGQLTKPRSQSHELVDGQRVHTYRGEMINGSDLNQREPSPQRLVSAYLFSKDKVNAVKAANSQTGKAKIYPSHEGLSLPYENALMQETTESEIYAGSAPFIWVGDRTRQIKGPHVAFAGLVANPVGVKVNATTKPEELEELINTINPHNEPGKLTLIFRMGREKIDDSLPQLLDVVKKHKEGVIAICDPMHGNTKTDLTTGKKTRYVEDIKQEVVHFTQLCKKAGVHPGGIHLEAASEEVTECLGDNVHYLAAETYKTLCDPCLNPTQAGRVALAYGEAYRM